MTNHIFKLGLSVFLERNSFNRDAASGAYEVTKQLPCQIAAKYDPLFASKNDPSDGAETGGAEPPERNGEFEYQIKSSSEAHARVVRESDLSRE